jgi:hypothetical protein
MKLKVCSRKGKQAFRRAGISFTPNPIEVDVTEEVAEILKNEAMLIVKEVEEAQEPKKTEPKEEAEIEKESLPEIKFIPRKRSKKK